MISGIFAGIMWALETVILGLALNSEFITSSCGQIAPFVCTFLHDAFSAVFLWIFLTAKGEIKNVLKIFRTSDFKWLIIASAVGGPIGMTGYVMAVNYMGSSIGAVASAVYPAIGSLLAYLFLKQKLKGSQWLFLVLTLLGVFGISYSPVLDISDLPLGLLGAFMCAFGWGTEGVILSKCMQNDDVKSEYALLIRQSTSAVIYGLVILPILNGLTLTGGLFGTEGLPALLTIGVAALCATVSYLLYYRTIAKKGVAKAMALNITYTAWAILFSVLFLRDYALLNVTTLGCGAVVVICGILSAADIKSIISIKKGEEK